MRTIVVGTDGSQTAGRAVAVAADLARRLGAELHLVHGYRPPGGTAEDMAGHGGVADQWRAAGAAILAEAGADPALFGLAVTTHVVAGGAADAVTGVARTVRADLIVVGNRGVQGPARLASESITAAVLQTAPCHVLVAKTT